MCNNALLDTIAKLKSCSAEEMSMFLALLRSEFADQVAAGLRITPKQFRTDLTELFDFGDKNYVKFKCPTCRSERYVLAEVVEAGRCAQCVHEPYPGYYEHDWGDTVDFNVRREYRCEYCDGKLADTIEELQEVISAAKDGYVTFKSEKSTNEELGILGK